MAAATLRKQEGIGLIVALAAHAGLIAWLALWKPEPDPVDLPESVSVTLSDEVGLVATTPDPSTDPAPATAPMAGNSLPPPAPEPLPTMEPRPVPPLARVVPTPPRPVPKPVTRPTPKRDPIADLLDRRPSPTARPTAKPTARPTGRPTAAPSGRPTGKPGAPDFAGAFGRGIPGATGTGGPPAQPGPQEVASIRGSINAKVRVPWNACSVTGLDVGKLRASVTFAMDKGGRVTSINPPVVTGVNDANRAQAARFGECAVNAIRKAAPYTNLPVQFYDHWKTYKLNFRKE